MSRVFLAARLLFENEVARMVLAPVNPELKWTFDCASSFNHVLCRKFSLIPSPLLVRFATPFLLLVKSPSLAPENKYSMSFLPSIASQIEARMLAGDYKVGILLTQSPCEIRHG